MLISQTFILDKRPFERISPVAQEPTGQAGYLLARCMLLEYFFELLKKFAPDRDEHRPKVLLRLYR